eukprot:5350607-Prymnesium_polylepis.1
MTTAVGERRVVPSAVAAMAAAPRRRCVVPSAVAAAAHSRALRARAAKTRTPVPRAPRAAPVPPRIARSAAWRARA